MKEGTTVKLEILRGEETIELEVERRTIILTHIVEKKINDNIGYLLIEDFDGGCADEFKEKFEDLQNQGIEKLIIDVRNNGGGIVDEAVEIADMLLDKGDTILITRNKNDDEEITKSDNDPIITMPVVILTNEY